MSNRKFKVIMIPDSTRIIIDAGWEEIDVDDEIEVYEEEKEIIHPDTNKSLGYYTLTKAKLVITETHENFSIARNQVKKETRGLADIASPMLGRTYYTYENITVNDQDNLNLNTHDKIIKIGDFVKISD